MSAYDEINTKLALLQDVDAKLIETIERVRKEAVGRSSDLLGLVHELSSHQKKLGELIAVQALTQTATNKVLEDLRKRVVAIETNRKQPWELLS